MNFVFYYDDDLSILNINRLHLEKKREGGWIDDGNEI